MAPPTTAMLPGATAAAGTCFIVKITAEILLITATFFFDLV